MPNLPVTNIIVDVTKSCNLACDYCFVTNLNQDQNYMQLETFLQVLDWFLLEASASETNLQLSFFGGEPLMNQKILQEMIIAAVEKAYHCKKQLKLSVNTNGTLLNNSILDFFEYHDIMLHVSIDGRPDTHNRHRYMLNGNGSYEFVAPWLKRLATFGDNVQISGTTNPDSVRNMHEDVKFLAGLGFRKIKLVPNMFLEWSRQDLEIYKKELEKIANDYINVCIKNEKAPFSMALIDVFINKRIHQATHIFPSHTPICGAGKSMLGISMDGGIYPCVSFTSYENDSFRLGDVNQGITKPDIYSMFSEKSAMVNTFCTGCSLFAGGCGCYFHNVNATGNIHQPSKVFCELVSYASLVADNVFECLFETHYRPIIQKEITRIDQL